MTRFLLVPTCALLLGASCASAQSFEEDVRAFDARLDQLRTEHRLPGLSAAIVKDQKQAWSKGYGWAHDEVPVTPDTPFWIASVTKPILGLLFLQLEADGEVDLHDRINDVPGWILSFEESGRERLIEVKTTKYGSETPFYVSRNEVSVSQRDAEKYQVYPLFDFRQCPHLYTLPGAIPK